MKILTIYNVVDFAICTFHKVLWQRSRIDGWEFWGRWDATNAKQSSGIVRSFRTKRQAGTQADRKREHIRKTRGISERHFKSYETEQWLKHRRLGENMTLVQRLISTNTLVPTLKGLKKSYRIDDQQSFGLLVLLLLKCARLFLNSVDKWLFALLLFHYLKNCLLANLTGKAFSYCPIESP